MPRIALGTGRRERGHLLKRLVLDLDPLPAATDLAALVALGHPPQANAMDRFLMSMHMAFDFRPDVLFAGEYLDVGFKVHLVLEIRFHHLEKTPGGRPGHRTSAAGA